MVDGYKTKSKIDSANKSNSFFANIVKNLRKIQCNTKNIINTYIEKNVISSSQCVEANDVIKVIPNLVPQK